MYFHLMCRIPCFHPLSKCLNSNELILKLTEQKLQVASSQYHYVIEPQSLVRQLHDEVVQKTLQTQREQPTQIRFLPIPSTDQDTVSICAITQIAGKEGFLLFSDAFSHIEFFAKREFPLTVW